MYQLIRQLRGEENEKWENPLSHHVNGVRPISPLEKFPPWIPQKCVQLISLVSLNPTSSKLINLMHHLEKQKIGLHFARHVSIRQH
jgi:hypothetical protein